MAEQQGSLGGGVFGEGDIWAERCEDEGIWERAGGGIRSQGLGGVGPGRGLWLKCCAGGWEGVEGRSQRGCEGPARAQAGGASDFVSGRGSVRATVLWNKTTGFRKWWRRSVLALLGGGLQAAAGAISWALRAPSSGCPPDLGSSSLLTSAPRAS